MSTMSDAKRKRSRRSFTEEFKAGAVRLVLEEGKTVGAAARDLDLTESSLRNWVEVIWELNSDGLPNGVGRNGLPSPLLTAFSSSRITFCGTAESTKTSVPITSIEQMWPSCAAIISVAWPTWAAT